MADEAVGAREGAVVDHEVETEVAADCSSRQQPQVVWQVPSDISVDDVYAAQEATN